MGSTQKVWIAGAVLFICSCLVNPGFVPAIVALIVHPTVPTVSAALATIAGIVTMALNKAPGQK